MTWRCGNWPIDRNRRLNTKYLRDSTRPYVTAWKIYQCRLRLTLEKERGRGDSCTGSGATYICSVQAVRGETGLSRGGARQVFHVIFVMYVPHEQVQGGTSNPSRLQKTKCVTSRQFHTCTHAIFFFNFFLHKIDMIVLSSPIYFSFFIQVSTATTLRSVRHQT